MLYNRSINGSSGVWPLPTAQCSSPGILWTTNARVISWHISTTNEISMKDAFIRIIFPFKFFFWSQASISSIARLFLESLCFMSHTGSLSVSFLVKNNYHIIIISYHFIPAQCHNFANAALRSGRNIRYIDFLWMVIESFWNYIEIFKEIAWLFLCGSSNRVLFVLSVSRGLLTQKQEKV